MGKKTTQNHDPVVLHNVINTLREGVYVTNVERVITYWNRGAIEITGYKADEVLGFRCRDNILEHLDNQGKNLCDTSCPLVEAMNNEELTEVEGYLIHKNGHRVPVYIRTAPVVNAKNKIVGACEVFGDISARVSHAKRVRELEKLAMADHLTGLPNRRFMEINLAERLVQVRQSGFSVGVVLYDVDHFKKVNDTYGHAAGDRVLKTVGATLLSSSRPPDLVGRWGGEEFIAILPNLTREALSNVTDRNRLLVEKSRFSENGTSFTVTVSLGVTFMDPDDDLGSLYRRVDSLLYQSKENGRNRVTMG